MGQIFKLSGEEEKPTINKATKSLFYNDVNAHESEQGNSFYMQPEKQGVLQQMGGLHSA